MGTCKFKPIQSNVHNQTAGMSHGNKCWQRGVDTAKWVHANVTGSLETSQSDVGLHK